MKVIETWEWWIVVAGVRRRTGYRCTEPEIRAAHPEAERVEGSMRAIQARRQTSSALTVDAARRKAAVPPPGAQRRLWKDEDL